MDRTNFNIRVYGLLIDQGRILVTDEYRLGIFMTKFPGGALEYGEGTIDCVKREFMEELNTEIEILEHFYTTDYFQPTTLLPSEMQLINIYYLVSLNQPCHFPVTDKKFDFPEIVDGAQCFRWLKISELSANEFTFPIDKNIVQKILLKFVH